MLMLKSIVMDWCQVQYMTQTMAVSQVSKAQNRTFDQSIFYIANCLSEIKKKILFAFLQTNMPQLLFPGNPLAIGIEAGSIWCCVKGCQMTAASREDKFELDINFIGIRSDNRLIDF
jgi:hypothetical protein